MKLGEPIDLTPEELAAAGGETPAGPVLGPPEDPLEDFDLYDAIETAKEENPQADPSDPGLATKVWDGVKNFLGDITAAGSEVMFLAGETDDAGQKVLSSLPGGSALAAVRAATRAPRITALATESSGKLLAAYKTIGEGAKAIGRKLSAWERYGLFTAEMERESRRATWQFLREMRDVDAITGHFNRTLETIFPQALAGLAAVPVDQSAARGLAAVADPANYVPPALAAGWTMRAPLQGAVKAAAASVRDAGLRVAESQARREAATIALKAGLPEAERSALRRKILEAGADYRSASTAREAAAGAYSDILRRQADELEHLKARVPLPDQVAGAGIGAAGVAADRVGAAAEWVANVPNKLAGMVAAENPAAREAIANGVRNVAGGFGFVPAVAGATGGALRSAGRDLRVVGRLLSEAEGQLPFFRRLAKETSGLTSWTASQVDGFRLAPLVTATGRAASAAAPGAGFMGALGFVQSGGDAEQVLPSAGVGAFLGMAGAGFGQWRRYSSPEVVRARQGADLGRYRNTLLPEQRSWFDGLDRENQVALSSFAHAHPDLQIRYSRMGKGADGFWYAGDNGAVAMVNLDSPRPLRSIVAHEVGHHVANHGLDAPLQRILLGDEAAGTPGVYTLTDRAGAPVLDAAGRFQTTPEFDVKKANYNARLARTAGADGVPRDNAYIAREIFAEHAADWLLGKDAQTGETNLGATMRAPSNRVVRSLAESWLGSNIPFLKRLAGKSGTVFGANGRVVGSELFGALRRSPELTELVRKYHHELAQRASPAPLDDGERGGISYDAAQIRANPKILDRLFDASGDVARDASGRVRFNPDGTPQFLSSQQQAQTNKALADKITAWIEANPREAAAAGIRSEVRPAKNGAKETVYVAASLPAPLLEQLAQDKQFNAAQIDNLRQLGAAAKSGKGNVFSFFYQPATRGGRDTRYRSLKGDWRTETPYAVEVSRAGNIFIRTASREKLLANAQRLIERGKGKLWGDDIGALQRDIDTYLANHAADRPGAADLGSERRDVINELFGVDLPSNAGANPIFDKTPNRSPIVFRSRRLDRINKLALVDGEAFVTDYPKVKANYRPADPGDSLVPRPSARPAPQQNLASLVELIADVRSRGITDRAGFERRYGNALRPIGEVPAAVAARIGVQDPRVYTGPGYFLDHHFNHHPNVDPARYYSIPDVLATGEVKVDNRPGHPDVYTFTKRFDKWHSMVVQLEQQQRNLILHKTFFSQSGEPNKKLPKL